MLFYMFNKLLLKSNRSVVLYETVNECFEKYAKVKIFSFGERLIVSWKFHNTAIASLNGAINVFARENTIIIPLLNIHYFVCYYPGNLFCI